MGMFYDEEGLLETTVTDMGLVITRHTTARIFTTMGALTDAVDTARPLYLKHAMRSGRVIEDCAPGAHAIMFADNEEHTSEIRGHYRLYALSEEFALNLYDMLPNPQKMLELATEMSKRW